MSRREFITLLAGATVTRPLTARAQAPVPTIGILDSVGVSAVTAFRSGLSDMGYVEGHGVAIKLRTTEQNDQLQR